MYARWEAGPWLLYDLHKDPQELQNLVNDAGYATELQALDKQLLAYMARVGDSWTLDWTAPVEDGERLVNYRTFYTCRNISRGQKPTQRCTGYFMTRAGQPYQRLRRNLCATDCGLPYRVNTVFILRFVLGRARTLKIDCALRTEKTSLFLRHGIQKTWKIGIKGAGALLRYSNLWRQR